MPMTMQATGSGPGALTVDASSLLAPASAALASDVAAQVGSVSTVAGSMVRPLNAPVRVTVRVRLVSFSTTKLN